MNGTPLYVIVKVCKLNESEDVVAVVKPDKLRASLAFYKEHEPGYEYVPHHFYTNILKVSKRMF